MCSKHKWIFCITFLLFFIFPREVKGVSVSLSTLVTTVSSYDEEIPINVNLNISSTNGTKYYLRGVFYKDGTSNYCGYTFNGSSWFNGPYSTNDGWKSLLEVTIQDTSWSGQLKAKMDPDDSACQGSGNYGFKIQRYTLAGSSSIDTQNSLLIQVNLPTPTPTPTPVPTETPTPSPTSTPTPTKTPTPIPTPTKTTAPSPKSTTISSLSSSPEELVLGIQGSLTTPEATPETLTNEKKKFPLFAVILISAGILCIAGALFFLVKENAKKNN